jgi:hypothetical protein
MLPADRKQCFHLSWTRSTLRCSRHSAPDHFSASSPAAPAPDVQRHRIAIRRSEFSLPVKCLLRDGLLDAVNVIGKSLWTACGRHAMIQMIESPN